MSERVEIGDAVLYHGDCIEILTTLGPVDALITDPPYSSGGLFRGDRADRSTKSKYVRSDTKAERPDFSGDNRDQRSFVAWCSIWLGRALRASKPGAVCCLFSDWRQLPSTTDALQCGGWVWRGLVSWDKTGSSRPAMGRFSQQCEFIAWGSAGPLPVERGVGCLPGSFSIPVEREKVHITQKPTNLLEEVIKIAPRGAVVLDPFMGSGTTGVACANLGRKFIGIEIERRYFDIACERIDAAYAQGRLFA